jgi:hypothetical protein
MERVVAARDDHVALKARAQLYVGYGWRLLPLATGGKEPAGALLHQIYGDSRIELFRSIAPASAEEVRLWFEVDPTINVGVFPSNTLGLVDIDKLDVVDLDVPTPTASSGREEGGLHLYLWCDRLLPTIKTEWGHVNPAYLVLPGSIHPSGRRYEWLPGRSPEDVELLDYREVLPLLGVEVESA